MYVPFVSKRALGRRKGGGGKGSGSKSSGSSSSSSSSGSKKSTSVSTTGTTKTATSYGNGGGKAITIPSGQLFAGRSEGGGTRQQVYGTSVYGSGYPGTTGRGVLNRGFPFYYWPLAWGGVAGIGGAAYLHDTEYGSSDNTSRPGGVEMVATFTSNSLNTTFHVLSDNATVISLISDVTTNCTSFLNSSTTSTSPSQYNGSDPSAPQPESSVEYYRASSVALTLDGYNNTAALSSDENATQIPLPTNIDTNLLACLNDTIGLAVPLIDGSNHSWSPPGLFLLISLLWSLLRTL